MRRRQPRFAQRFHSSTVHVEGAALQETQSCAARGGLVKRSVTIAIIVTPAVVAQIAVVAIKAMVEAIMALVPARRGNIACRCDVDGSGRDDNRRGCAELDEDINARKRRRGGEQTCYSSDTQNAFHVFSPQCPPTKGGARMRAIHAIELTHAR